MQAPLLPKVACVVPTANAGLVYRDECHSKGIVWHNITIYTATVNKQVSQAQNSKVNTSLQFSVTAYKQKTVLSYPNNMVHSIDIAVTHVNPDCSDGEAILFS